LDQDAAYLDLHYWRSLSAHHAQGGDLVIAGLGDESNPVGRATVLPELGPAIVKADCYRIRLKPSAAEARFVAWYLSSGDGLTQSARLADGATRPRLTLEKALTLKVPTLPVARQRAIADFLDRETTRIDSLIVARRRMVDVLEARRATVMHAGVSGAYGSAPTRPASSIPWLTAIPDCWEAAKLTRVARLASGHTPNRDHPEWWGELTIPWITTGEVAQMRSDRMEYITHTRENISEVGLANSAAELHPTGTVVLCRTAASAGYSAIMGLPMATSQDFAAWICGPRLRPRFLLLCLRVMRQDLLGRLAMGSTHRTIYMPEIKSIRIPLPPVGEQEEIARVVHTQLGVIDKAMELLDRQLNLLSERRQALITAAVTGQLDIPGVAA
jgi:type I restriction enzyme, S subunit